MLSNFGAPTARPTASAAARAATLNTFSPGLAWPANGAAAAPRSGPSALATAIQGLLYAAIVIGCLHLTAFAVGQEMHQPYEVLALLSGVLTFVALRNFDLTGAWHVGRAGSDGNRLLINWAGIVSLLLLIGWGTKWTEYFSRKVLMLWFVASPLALVAVNGGVRWLAGHAVGVASARRTVMVYANETARRFAHSVRRSDTFDVRGFFEDRSLERVGGGVPGLSFLGKTSEVADYVRANNIEVVFIFLSYLNTPNAKALLEALGDTTASVYYVPDFELFDEPGTRMISVESVPMLEVVETPLYGVDGLLKQALDSLLALCALTALSVPMLVVAMLIKLSSPGPVLFKQKRYGLNGKEFSIYKFRSMTVADRSKEIQQVSRNDQRVTPIGRILRRTSIDELPQLFNVLRGEMSLVGPRPHSVAHNEFYRKAVRRYMLRHKVKPGLTGLAQVNGFRGETAQIELMEQRIRYDLEYIRNWSFWLDAKIILRTIAIVLRGDNAY